MGWATTFRTLGPAGSASYALSRVVEHIPGLVYRRYRIVAVPRHSMPAMPRGHAARPLDDAELRAAAAPLALTDATIDYRRAQGMTCLGAFRGDRLLGVTWLTDRPFDEDEIAVRFVPPPGAGWDTGMYLRAEERGGRGFAALWAGTAAWLAARGLDWSMSRINDYNDASWRAHRRLGARCVDTLTAVRFGGRQWLPGRPASGRGGAASRPVILLAAPEAA
jgi:hypothetical protein